MAKIVLPHSQLSLKRVQPAKLTETNLISLLNFDMFYHPPRFASLCEINTTHLGNVPSGAQGYLQPQTSIHQLIEHIL